VYAYWLTLSRLLKEGYPYDAIINFSPEEINIILAMEKAVSERQQDEQERQQRVQTARQNFNRGR
tara:strand:- start:4 stop:198 length:195 start_codon:yes stop_codon:yes gene_type:complete